MSYVKSAPALTPTVRAGAELTEGHNARISRSGLPAARGAAR